MNSSSIPRILLIASHQPGVAEILAGCGFSVQLAADDSEALAILLGSEPPAIVLLDSRTFGLPILKLVAELRRRRSSKQTWIILLAAAVDPATVAAAAEAGVDDMLLCPPNQPIGEVDLCVRLGVATRVQEMTRQFEAKVKAHSIAATFHASHDHLTGLLNRESLLSMLFAETDRVQRIGTPLGFLVLDLDHFSRVNEHYGYEIGDKILQELASRLRRYMRSYDLIGRCDADEFLIALPGCNSARALHLAGRIRTILLHRPFVAGSANVTLTASIGLAQSRGRSPLVVLREAERALAAAKLEGRNREHEYLPPPQTREETLKEQLI